MERARGSHHCAQGDTQSAILNLEQGEAVTHWGRLICYVTDADALWNHLKDRGSDPEIPRDAAWGERVAGELLFRAAVHCQVRSQPQQPARARGSGDELRLQRLVGDQDVARHLGKRPGHRRGQVGRRWPNSSRSLNANTPRRSGAYAVKAKGGSPGTARVSFNPYDSSPGRNPESVGFVSTATPQR